LSVTAGGSGEGEQFTIVLSQQDGSSMPTLHNVVRSTFGGVDFGAIVTQGTFTDAAGVQANTPSGANTPLIHYADTWAPLGPYLTPFSLESRATIFATSLSRDPSSPGGVRFTHLVSAIPEPASLVMGAVAALVGLGVLRRKPAVG